MKTGLPQLLYPLNIYAAAMQRDQGSITYLSYGWVGDELSQLGLPLDAQQNVADKILGLINKPAGSRILDVGCGTGELMSALAAQGFDVHGLDSNAQAVALTRQTLMACGQEGRIIHADFVKAWQSMDAGCFDVIILQNSFRYFTPVLVFAAAMHLLAPGGQLIIFDEFTVDIDEQRLPRELPVLDYAMAEAARNGLKLSQQEDLSDGVIAFMTDFCARLERQAPALIHDHVLSDAAWAELLSALQDELVAMQQGRRTHQLLQYDMTVYDPEKISERPLIIPAEIKSTAEYASLFESCFDTPFCPDLWQWKYGGGRGASVAAYKGDRVVAHYGGMVRSIEYFGRPERGIQIGDVMVLPTERGFFSRNGLFFKTAAAMLEQNIGYSASNLLGFGFPNIKAMHVAQRLKLYEKTDDLVSLTLKPLTDMDEQRVDSALSVESVLPVEYKDWISIDDDFIDRVWGRMKDSLKDAIVGVRDANYVRFRYQQRPGMKYHLLVVDEHGKTPGLVVYRQHGEQEMALDVIAAADDVVAVLTAAMQHVGNHGRNLHEGEVSGREMFFWLTRGQYQCLHEDRFLVSDTAIQIPCNAWSHGPDCETLKGAWWLTAGDTDFL